MILDSSFLIDLQRGSRHAVDTVTKHEAEGRPMRVPFVVIYELFVGVGKGARTEENRRRVRRVLDRFSSVSPTERIMERAGYLDGFVQREFGGEIGTADAIVAATAIEYDEPVVTDDVTDFEKVPAAEFRVETY